ncbi:hypothetical protein CYMTET_50365 [Cymbomonas tetramitiformis]|uniref:Uncharacterized protein n=1 Tax=Cymbomonas tetramitiformis TaxID=36881 RepID=A0AAE0BPW8_9CHLO|nr:hypothetical protein CYMTET_50365 [Cymbomonas tetramitiformis]
MARLTVDSPGSSPVTKLIRQPASKRIAKPPAASSSSEPIISVPETPVPSAQSSPKKSELSDRMTQLTARIEELTAENAELKVNLSETEAEVECAEADVTKLKDQNIQLQKSNLEACTLTNELTAEVAALKKAPATKIRVLKSPDRTSDDKDQRIAELQAEVETLQEKYEDLEDTACNTERIFVEEINSLRHQVDSLEKQLAAAATEKTIAMADKRRVELAAEAEEKKLKKAAAAEKKNKGKKKADPQLTKDPQYCAETRFSRLTSTFFYLQVVMPVTTRAMSAITESATETAAAAKPVVFKKNYRYDMAPKQSTLAGAGATEATTEGGPLKSPRGHGGKRLLYAIRGGPKAGVYTRWYQAVDAGFKTKQGTGNGVSFEEHENDLAQEWAFDNTNLQPEGKAAVIQQSIKDKHILVRVLFVTIIFTVIFHLTHLGVDAIGWWNDCDDKVHRKLAVCIGNAELNLFLLKYEVEITAFCYAQFIAMMIGLFVWLVVTDDKGKKPEVDPNAAVAPAQELTVKVTRSVAKKQARLAEKAEKLLGNPAEDFDVEPEEMGFDGAKSDEDPDNDDGGDNACDSDDDEHDSKVIARMLCVAKYRIWKDRLPRDKQRRTKLRAHVVFQDFQEDPVLTELLETHCKKLRVEFDAFMHRVYKGEISPTTLKPYHPQA